jgi:hypothetical protein
MIHALAFTLATALVVVGAYLALTATQLSDALDRTLAFLVFASAQIIITLLVAGTVFERLDVPTVLATNGALVAALLTLSVLTNRLNFRLPPFRIKPAATLEIALQSPWASALIALAVTQVLWRLFVAWILPPLGFDALWYHLTTVAWWLQNGRITGNPLVLWSDVYPADSELGATWIALFLHKDTFVDLAQLPIGIMGALAVVGIARTVGVTKQMAAAAGALFFLSPIVLVEVSAAYADLFVASGFLVAVHFGLRYLTPAAARNPSLLVLAGFGAGLALGSKYVGAVYFAVVGAWLVVAVAAHFGALASLRAVLLFSVPALALGGFWYARNWVQHGSPVYPFGRAASSPVLSGPEGCKGVCWHEILWQWHQDHVPVVPFHRFNIDLGRGGLGPLWSYVEAPILPLVVAYAAVRSRRFVWGLFIPVALAFAVQPYRWWSRFTIILLALGAVALVYAIQRLPNRVAAVAKLLTLALVILGLSYSTPASSVVDGLRRTKQGRTAAQFSEPWFEWVSNAPAGSRIAADTSTDDGLPGGGALIWYFYPLFGDRFQFQVTPLVGRSDASVARNLADKQVDYLIIGAEGPYAPFVRHARQRNCLTAVFSDRTAEAYGIDRACLRSISGM